MWLPKSEADIIQAIHSNSLEESAIFDGKGSIPTKSSEIAKDIAAMCNDGGIILYGISEDENGRLIKISPFPLEGQKERISSIVQTSISEPPVVFIKSIPSESNPTIGYIIIEVPPSDRAPHMVVIKGENRFYGRTAGGNIPLNEGDVSRLYGRRKRAEIDIALILEEQIKNAPIKPNPKFGYCFSTFRPVQTDSLLVDKAITPEKPIFGLLFDLIDEAIKVDPLQGNYYPHFSVHNSGRWEYILNGYRAKLIYPENISKEDAPGDMLVFELEKSGTGHLFCGRAAENENGNLTLFSDCIIGNFVNSLFLLGQIYKRAGYIGSLDIGIAITGIRGCLLYSKDRYLINNAPIYDRESYTSAKRLSAKLLFEQSSILSIADELLSPLFITLTQNRFDVFEKAKRKIGLTK